MNYKKIENIIKKLKSQDDDYSLLQIGELTIISNKKYKKNYSFMILETENGKLTLTPVKFTETNKIEILNKTIILKKQSDLIKLINLNEINFFKA